MTMKIGDNPGGVEAVTVTPLSGMGHTVLGSNVASFAGGTEGGTGGGGGGGGLGSFTSWASGVEQASDRVVDAAQAATNAINAIPGEPSGRAEKRINAAGSAAEKLAGIARDAGQKLVEIDEDTQEKLIAIDEKAAKKRAEIAKKLAEDIMTTMADMVAEQESNDLELVGADEKKMASLQAREEAERTALASLADAQAEAQATAAAGEAELAQDVLDIREKAIAQQQALDEEYARRRAELAGDPAAQAELQRQYQEASDAIAAAEEIRVQLAIAAAEERKQAIENEKLAVIAAAEEQKQSVIAKAIEQANGVKGASEAQKAAVVAAFAAQAAAAAKWADDTAVAMGLVEDAAQAAADAINDIPAPPSSDSSGGGDSGGQGASGGGSAFVTSGPMTMKVGDNPGGIEAVTVTPLSGMGHTVLGPNAASFGGGTDSLIADKDAKPDTPMVTLAPAAAAEAATIAGMTGAADLSSAEGVFTAANNLIKLAIAYAVQVQFAGSMLENYGKAISGTMAVFDTLRTFAEKTQQEVPPPLDMAVVNKLALEAKNFVQTVYDNLIPLTEEQNDALKTYIGAAKSAMDMLDGVASLAATLVEPPPPIPPELIQRLARGATEALTLTIEALVPVADDQLVNLKFYAEATKQAVGVLTAVSALGKAVAEFDSPLGEEDLMPLATASKRALWVVSQILVPSTTEAVDELTRYQSAVGAAVATLTSVAGLHAAKEAYLYPLGEEDLIPLANAAKRALWVVSQVLVPITEEQASEMQRFGGAVQSAVSTLTSIAQLHAAVADLGPVIDLALMQALASEAARVTQIVQGTLIPVTEEQASGLQRYAGAAQSGVSILSAIAQLRAAVTEPSPPIDEALIRSLAADAQRVERIVSASLVPVTEEEGKALQAYAAATQSAVGVIQSAIGLSGALFADYVSPSDAQLDMIANDARRIADRIMAAAKTYDTDGLAAGKAFADAVGGTFAAFKDGLLFFDALKSGDFELDPANLAKFEAATLSTLDTAKRLGAVAATIPAGDIAALQSTTAALSAQAEALIRLSAVPFGDIGAASAGLAAHGGALAGGGGVTFGPGSIVINAAAGVNTEQIAQQVIQRANQLIQSRR
jgi:hypothetical protein